MIKTPFVHWQWASGAGYSPDNRGGIAGNILADVEGKFLQAEAWCDTYGFNALCFNLLVGFPLGTNCPVATTGVLQTFYPGVWDFLTNTFPFIRRPNRTYSIYIGGRQSAPFNQNEYNTASSEIPPASFFVEAISLLKPLGFSNVWVDALGGAPELEGYADSVLSALAADGWSVGTELWPHNGVPISGSFDVKLAPAMRWPYMIVGRDFGYTNSSQVGGDFFSPRFDAAPPGTALHVCPQFGDNLFTPEMAQMLHDKGVVLSPYIGFDITRPDTMEVIRQINLLGAEQVPNIKLNAMKPSGTTSTVSATATTVTYPLSVQNTSTAAIKLARFRLDFNGTDTAFKKVAGEIIISDNAGSGGTDGIMYDGTQQTADPTAITGIVVKVGRGPGATNARVAKVFTANLYSQTADYISLDGMELKQNQQATIKLTSLGMTSAVDVGAAEMSIDVPN